MSLLSFLFEGMLAVLMVLLIVYCVRLNRGLTAIRSSDTQINELIGRLVEASDRAEASVAQLKAVGIQQERALRSAIDDAEQVRARLAPADPVAPAAPMAAEDNADNALPDGVAASLQSLAALRDGRRSPAAPDSGSAEPRPGERKETEQALLAAIRHARAAG